MSRRPYFTVFFPTYAPSLRQKKEQFYEIHVAEFSKVIGLVTGILIPVEDPHEKGLSFYVMTLDLR